MAFNSRLLGTGERVVMHLRTHKKALVLPLFWLIALPVVGGIGAVYLPQEGRPWSLYAMVGVLLVGLIALVVAPFLRWWTTTYTVTDRRLISRRGLLTRSGHDLPLSRITDVNYERSLTDRLLGCGTLVLMTASDDPVTLHDVPHVEQVHVQLSDLLFSPQPVTRQVARPRYSDDDTQELPASYATPVHEL